MSMIKRIVLCFGLILLTGCSELGASSSFDYDDYTSPEDYDYYNEEVYNEPESYDYEPTYECSYNAYNCGDFSSRSAAWDVFNYCMDQVGYDVHDLDRDDDGPCDSL